MFSYQYTRLLQVLSWHCVLVLSGSVLVAELTVLAGQTSGLLLQVVKILLSLGELLLQVADLVGTTSLVDLVAELSLGLGITLVLLDLGLELESLENLKDVRKVHFFRAIAVTYHHVGAVEDQRKEQCEATKVHVALGVELAGLDLHALVSENGSTRCGQ